ncbi:hypothetical protein [Spirosoma utsteinense]|uniref:Uncharacterized protein n=1 Tax=Spirosoma utsteinense TaxID=2585773 RepID=A0ABR6WEL7_9BACT|nr:hypothetical protein [Spirosoma utsteinense]MBC3794972.1 hypothetical protein [Spirosoma utsteinense]
MKADVQHNDFKGTVAADISDFHDLSDFLNDKGVDTNRYDPIGTKFYPQPHHEGNLSVAVICLDKEKTTKEVPYIVEIALEEPVEYAEYFGLFKRFSAIVIGDYYQQFEINDFIRMDELGGDEQA